MFGGFKKRSGQTETTPGVYSSLGSRRAVRLWGVRGASPSSEHEDQHVEDGQPLRQRPHGIVFQDVEVRGVHLSNYETYDDVIERLPHFIEEVYNKKRMHSALGYLPPEEYEIRIQKPKTAARAPLKSR